MFVLNNEVLVDCDIPSSPPPPPPLHSPPCPNHLRVNNSASPSLTNIKLNFYDALYTFILSLGLLTLLRLALLYLSTQVSYVSFNTDLNLRTKKRNFLASTLLASTESISLYLSLVMLSVVISECEKELFVVFIIRTNPNFGYVVGLSLKYSKNISRVISDISTVYIFFISITPATCTICLIICQIWCHSHIKRVSLWLPIILIILSNDINLNPGPNF